MATNRPLDEEVSAGRFRSDLYYRLNVVAFPIPPLRNRQADIEPLAQRFLAHFSQRTERPIRGFTRAALEALWSYGWPGNIRELRNTVGTAWPSALRPRSTWKTFPSRSSGPTSAALVAVRRFPLWDASRRQQAGRRPQRRRVAAPAGGPRPP